MAGSKIQSLPALTNPPDDSLMYLVDPGAGDFKVSRSGVLSWLDIKGLDGLNDQLFFPVNYGAVGDGTTDDTVALQATIDAAQAVRGKVMLGPFTYKITSSLVISDSVSIQGTGCLPVWGGREIFGADVFPMVSPYLEGTVILVAANATNAINITAIGGAVNLREFGIRFNNAFTNTGHGIYANSGAFTFAPSAPQYSEPNGSAPHTNIGIAGSTWDSIYVYGQDGNHYAYNITNCQLNTFNNCQCFGGGGWRFFVDTPTGYYGNSTLINPYVCLSEGGTANGYHFDNTWAGHGLIYTVLIRPQTFSFSERTTMVTPMTGTQYLAWFGNDSWYISIVGGNWEGSGHSGVRAPQYKHGWAMDREAYWETSKDIQVQLGDPTDYHSISFMEDNGTSSVPHAYIQRIGTTYSDVARRGAFEIGTLNSHNFDFFTASTNRMRIGLDGMVRIGTTSTSIIDGINYPRLAVASFADSTKWVATGWDDTNDRGFIYAVDHDTIFKELALNPAGGIVTIGTGGLTVNGTSTFNATPTVRATTTAGSSQISFSEVSTPMSFIQQVGSTYVTTGRRGALEVGTLGANPLDLWTNSVHQARLGSDGALRMGTVTASLVDGTRTPKFVVANPSDSNKWVGIGYHNATNSAFIQSVNHATEYRPLDLNPEGGPVTMKSMATYANDAAADADAALPSGGLYRTTAGGRTVYRKP